MVMRFHWGIAIGHLYAHDHNKLPAWAAETNAQLENAVVAGTVANTPIASGSNTFPSASEPNDWLRLPGGHQVDGDVLQAESHIENHQANSWEGDNNDMHSGEIHPDDNVLHAEFSLENRQDNNWEEDNGDIYGGKSHPDEEGWEIESDDDVFSAMHDMYGTRLHHQ
jgi:hypothetical protein